jgi:hypothetical protein
MSKWSSPKTNFHKEKYKFLKENETFLMNNELFSQKGLSSLGKHMFQIFLQL